MGGEHDFDCLVIGSGFGGSVSALRLRRDRRAVADEEVLVLAAAARRWPSTR